MLCAAPLLGSLMDFFSMRPPPIKRPKVAARVLEVEVMRADNLPKTDTFGCAAAAARRRSAASRADSEGRGLKRMSRAGDGCALPP